MNTLSGWLIGWLKRIIMKTYNIIPIGTKVIIHDILEAMVMSISIRKTHIVYEVQITTENGINTYWVSEWEITSNHKMDLAISSLIKAD